MATTNARAKQKTPNKRVQAAKPKMALRTPHRSSFPIIYFIQLCA